MADELTAEQSENLTRALELAKELLALPSVSKAESRFEAEVALVVTSEGLDEATAIIERRTGAPAKAAKAPLPDELKGVADSFGGIRGGQTLYTHDVGDGLLLCVAFWPWGSGAQITIKIAVRESA